MQCFAPCFAVGAANRHTVSSSKGKSVGGGFLFHHSTAEADAQVYLTAPPAAAQWRTKDAAKPQEGSCASSVESSGSSSLAGSSAPGHTQAGSTDRTVLLQYLQQHGRSFMAVSTLHQEGLMHFVMPGVGYIAYASMFNGPEFLNKQSAVALSDPVCDPQHFRLMAAAFLQQHPKAMFLQVSADFAAVLQELGYLVNAMGGETRLDVAAYSFSGYARRGLRSAIAAAVKEGISVQEVMVAPPADAAAAAALAQLAEEMRQLDAKWATGKVGRASEVWFINRRPVFAPEPGVRKLVARDAAGVLRGYIFFDGVFEGGRLVGYYANVTRLAPDAHPGTLNLIIREFLDRLRAEAHLEPPCKKLSIKRSVRKKQAAAAAAAAAAATAAAGGDDTANTPDTAAAAAGPALAGAAGGIDQGLKLVPASSSSSRGPKALTPAAAPAPAAAAAPASPAAAEEGSPRLFLSLGLSPFYQMDSTGFKTCPVAHKTLEKCFALGDAVYPARTLAAAKAKYGAGLHNGHYEDAAVQYRQHYLCHRRGGAGSMVALFDLAKMCGLWKHPADAVARMISYKARTLGQKSKKSA